MLRGEVKSINQQNIQIIGGMQSNYYFFSLSTSSLSLNSGGRKINEITELDDRR